MKTLFPIGSVVLLKGGERPLMIVGFRQKEARTNKVWDYSAVLHPDGLFDSNSLYLFNADQIESLLFMGFLDTEGLRYLHELTRQSQADSNESFWI